MFDEDLDAFFEDFAEKGSSHYGDFDAIIDSAFYEFEGIDDDRTVATCKTREVVKIRRGDLVVIGGRSYHVKAVQPNGEITGLVIY